jgi:hypothetical protein
LARVGGEDGTSGSARESSGTRWAVRVGWGVASAASHLVFRRRELPW